MVTVSAALVVGFHLAYPPKQSTVPLTGRGGRLFVLNGLAIGAGILSMQWAISLESLSLVAPLVSTTPIVTLILGLVVFREERPTAKHMVIGVLVVAGAVLIVSQ